MTRIGALMVSTRKILTFSITSILIAGLATFLALLYTARFQQARAEQCLTEVFRLESTHASFDEVNEISRRFGGAGDGSLGQACTAERCSFFIPFDNHRASKTGLVGYAQVTV